RSGRRTVRNGRRHRAGESWLVLRNPVLRNLVPGNAEACRPGCLEKCVHLSMILSARRAFDARTGVDAPGVSQLDGPRDVGCIQAAGHNDAPGRSGGQTPIERAAPAAVEL